jgi:hypothetical protein
VPNAGYIKNIMDMARGRVPRTGAKLYPFSEAEGWDVQHLHYFTISELTWLLKKNDFEVKKVFSRGRYQLLRQIFPSLLYASIGILASLRKKN